MKYFNVFYFLMLVLFFSCKEYESKENMNSNSNEHSSNATVQEIFDYFPTSTSNAIYNHEGYSFSYVEKHEQSEWVAYFLDKNNNSYAEFERPFFEIDESVITKSAHWRNYKNSGYDKGHLCPAGDRKGSVELYNETFLTSNVSPQKSDFNAGIWNRLEQKIRYWANKYDGLYIITAGVLEENLKTIGTEEVAVPNYFYKVLLTKDKSRMIAFLVPHQDSDEPLYKFVVSVDELEEKTGIDFFKNLEDSSENKMESSKDYKKWAF